MKKLAFLMLANLSSLAVAAPETYLIDPAHTQPRFEYDHLGFSRQTHRFTRTSGRILIDRIAQKGSVDVEIDARSVETGYDQFNQHIQGEDYFQTDRYPIIRFRSNDLHFVGDRPVSVMGELTIKDIHRPVTLTITSLKCMPHPIRHKEACGANATALVKRSEFGMGKYVPLVGDEVTLQIPVEAILE